MDDAIAHGGGTRPGAVAVWIQAIRAPSLSAAAIPVLLGVAVAAREGFFSLSRMILALVGAMAIQAGTNLINDYYDFRSGADSEQSLGPSMVIQRGLLSADQVWRGGIAAFAIGALIGLVLVYQCGWPILAIGIPSVAAGYFYTASSGLARLCGARRVDRVHFYGAGDRRRLVLRDGDAHFVVGDLGVDTARISGRRNFARQQYSRHRERHAPRQADARDDTWTYGCELRADRAGRCGLR